MQTKIKFNQLEDAPLDGFQYARQSGSWTSVTGSGAVSASDGWTPYSAVVPILFVSDDPVYTLQFTASNVTGTFQAGMPIKFTQNGTVRFGFFCANASYVSGSYTTIPVLTRCDTSGTGYDVLNTATYPITDFNYAPVKQPGFGFPVSPEYWTVEFTLNSDGSQASPVNGTWYNLANMWLDIPIGSWRVIYQGCLFGVKNGTQYGCIATLSTANNSESDKEFTTQVATVTSVSSFTGENYAFSMTAREKLLTLLAKTRYYLNIRNTNASESIIGVNGATSKTLIKAFSTYI